MMGNAIPVNSGEMHATHVQEHIPVVVQTLNGIEVGDIDPMQSLPGLQAALNHLSAHGEALAQDNTQAPLYNAVKEAVNNAAQVVNNMDRKLRAEQRRAAESRAVEGGEQGDPTMAAKARAEEIKLAMLEFKAELAQRKGELELATMEARAAQNLALNDAKAAEAIQKKIQYPRSDYGVRR